MSNGNMIRKAALVLLSMQRHSWEQGGCHAGFSGNGGYGNGNCHGH